MAEQFRHQRRLEAQHGQELCRPGPALQHEHRRRFRFQVCLVKTCFFEVYIVRSSAASVRKDYDYKIRFILQ